MPETSVIENERRITSLENKVDNLADKIDTYSSYVAEKFGQLVPRVEAVENNNKLQRQIEGLSSEFKTYADSNNRAVEAMSSSITRLNDTMGKHMERMALINEENMRMKGEQEKEKHASEKRQIEEQLVAFKNQAEANKLQNVITRLWAPIMAFLITFGGILWMVFQWIEKVGK